MQELHERQTELEIRLSYQDKTIEELNDVVTELARRVQRLERDNSRLREMLATLAPEMETSPDE